MWIIVRADGMFFQKTVDRGTHLWTSKTVLAHWFLARADAEFKASIVGGQAKNLGTP